MSAETKIQWCDHTVNPVMGCDGCPLSPPPGMVALKLIEKLKSKTTHPEDAENPETTQPQTENSTDEQEA